MRIRADDLLDFDEGDLSSAGLSSIVRVTAGALHGVVMDGTVIVEFSPEDIEEGLDGLDVDVESLEEFLSRFELKRLAVMAVIEVVHGAGKIPLENLGEILCGYRIESEEVSRCVEDTLEPDFLSTLVAEMRNLGYLTGSQENIRLVR